MTGYKGHGIACTRGAHEKSRVGQGALHRVVQQRWQRDVTGGNDHLRWTSVRQQRIEGGLRPRQGGSNSFHAVAQRSRYSQCTRQQQWPLPISANDGKRIKKRSLDASWSARRQPFLCCGGGLNILGEQSHTVRPLLPPAPESVCPTGSPLLARLPHPVRYRTPPPGCMAFPRGLLDDPESIRRRLPREILCDPPRKRSFDGLRVGEHIH